MNKNFWNGKNVLITGHTGFKGSWLTCMLKKFGANIIGFSKDIPTKPSLYEILELENDVKGYQGDINDLNQIRKIIVEERPEIVFHMAAQSLVRESYRKPHETFTTNILGTVNLLEVIKNSKYPRVGLIITSDKVYKNIGKNEKFSEEHPLGGNDPYSSSKGCAELVTSAYRNSFFNSRNFSDHNFSLSTVRAGNVIGGGDWAKDRLIPDIVRSIQNQNSLKIRNPNAIRPWQHVLDPLSGYIHLAEKMWKNKEFSEAWNFGPTFEEDKTVEFILNFIDKKMNKNFNIEFENDSNLHEAKMLRLDSSKVENRLGWKSKLNLETSLLLTIEWYNEFINNSDMKKITEQQIEKFLSM